MVEIGEAVSSGGRVVTAIGDRDRKPVDRDWRANQSGLPSEAKRLITRLY